MVFVLACPKFISMHVHASTRRAGMHSSREEEESVCDSPQPALDSSLMSHKARHSVLSTVKAFGAAAGEGCPTETTAANFAIHKDWKSLNCGTASQSLSQQKAHLTHYNRHDVHHGQAQCRSAGAEQDEQPGLLGRFPREQRHASVQRLSPLSSSGAFAQWPRQRGGAGA
jgi:hypothetical protein